MRRSLSYYVIDYKAGFCFYFSVKAKKKNQNLQKLGVQNDSGKEQEDTMDRENVNGISCKTNEITQLKQQKSQITQKIQIENILKERRPIPCIRFDRHEHFPKLSETKTRCKNEKCHKLTVVYCTKCKVHLCFVKNRNCFTNFHISNTDDHHKNITVISEANLKEIRPDFLIRFDKQCHLPVVTNTEVRCKNENCKKKTFVFCNKCKVHLCLVNNRNCFLKFHSLAKTENCSLIVENPTEVIIN